MRSLVTGGGGFLGQYIVERLVARGEKVSVLCRGYYPELEKLGVDIIRGDLRHPNDVLRACQGQDVVYHTAALPGVGLKRQPYYETNVQGTQNVLNACIALGIDRLVYTSSPSVTDGGSPLLGVDETAPYPEHFLSHYPETKAIAERLVLAANGTELTGTHKKLLTCALRPRLMWGPRDRHLIPRLLQRAREGRLVRVGDGTNILDMVYVENAADAHLLAADALTPNSPVCGRAYYITQGRPINCWDWINTILRMVGLPPVRRSISFRTAWYCGVFLETIYKIFRLNGEPSMTRFLATQLAQSYWFNIERAKQDLGYSPKISTEEGLERLAAEFKSRNH